MAAGAGQPASPAADQPRVPRPGPAIDFRPGWPDVSSFPRHEWLWALRDATRTAPDAAFGYGNPHGAAELREVIASYLRRVRGAVADPERVVICAGFAQALNLVLRALAHHNVGTIAFEDLGRADDRATAERWGLTARPVAVDEQGLDVEELAQTNARGVLMTPAHQSPTGVVLSPARGRALVAWLDPSDPIRRARAQGLTRDNHLAGEPRAQRALRHAAEQTKQIPRSATSECALFAGGTRLAIRAELERSASSPIARSR